MVTKTVQLGMRAVTGRRLAVAAIGFATAAVLMAQYRINTRINTGMQGTGVGSIRHTNLPFYRASTPSGRRHATFLSGSLRSEVRGQYLLKGPLAPSGALSYIPSSRRPYGSFTVRGLSNTPRLSDRPFSVSNSLVGRPAMGSLRYSSSRVSTLPWRGSGGLKPGRLNYPTSSAFGRTRYGSLRYGP